MTDGCWYWTGYRMANGYGKTADQKLIHRVVYEIFKGPIPAGMWIDHLCRVRHCVNPEHLRACTPRENTLAPGSLAPSAYAAARMCCPRGHPYDKTRLGRRGRLNRRCSICHAKQERDRQRRYHLSIPDAGEVDVL